MYVYNYVSNAKFLFINSTITDNNRPALDFIHDNQGVEVRIDYIPYNEPYGFDQLMLDLIADNNPAKVFRHNGYWLDIGRPDDYTKACEDINFIVKGSK